MEQNLLQKLAKHLNLTDEVEEEPYTLTPEEEETHIRAEIESLKNYYRWKMGDRKFTPDEVEFKLSQMDFKGMINREQSLAYANMCKNQNTWHNERRKQERDEYAKKQVELTTTWTAKFVYALMGHTSEEHFGKRLIVHEGNKRLISALCFLISRDERFVEDLNLDFNKGLLIRGKCGIGKTHLVRCVESNAIRPILTVSMIEISEKIKADGEYELPRGSYKIIYLDDVGTEEAIVNHFGTRVNFFKQFIESAYMNTKNYSHLIISTNLNFKEISDKYGFRVESRMREMFNVIDVDGPDLRNPKFKQGELYDNH